MVGDSVQIIFTATGLSAGAQTSINVTIVDEYNNPINSNGSSWTIAITANASGVANYTYDAPTHRLGYYKVFATLLSDRSTLPSVGTRPAGFITYVVVPDPTTRRDYGDTGSRFGLQGGFSSKAVVIPYLGVRVTFEMATSWSALEQDRPREFVNLTLSEQQSAMSSWVNPTFGPYGNLTWNVYTLACPTQAALPPWAILAGTTGSVCTSFGAVNPNGVSEGPAFFSSEASAFASLVPNQKKHFYQVTWEPQTTWCFDGTPEQLVQIYELSYPSIKSADPNAVVVGPTLFIDSASTSALSGLYAAGLGNFSDGLSIHPYTSYPPELATSSYDGFVPTLRAQVDLASSAIGVSKAPFVGTEHGFTTLAQGDLQKAQADVRVAVMMVGEGAAFDIGFYITDYWTNFDLTTNAGYGFYWGLDASIPGGFGSDKISPKPSAAAYAAMTYFLDGTNTNGAVTGLNGTQLGYSFTNIVTGVVTTVLWDWANSATSYTVPSGMTICDFMGNCGQETSAPTEIALSESVVYLISNPSASSNNSNSSDASHSSSSLSLLLKFLFLLFVE